MRIIKAKPGNHIYLGRLGENEATTVVFDVAEWLQLFGEGTFTLFAKRSGDAVAYPCVTERRGSAVHWVIKGADVAAEGYGRCELILTIGNTIAKSEIYTTVVGAALTEGVDVPEPYTEWVQQVINAADRAEEATKHNPMIGEDGYWYLWNTDTEQYEKTDYKATGGGEGGTADHRELTNRDAADQHPMSAITGLTAALAGKQSAISDLAEIRSGAELGATALQPDDISEWAKAEDKPSYTAAEISYSDTTVGAALGGKANDSNVYHEHRLMYDGSVISYEGTIQTFSQIHQAVEDKTKFVFIVFQNRLYVPQYSASALVSFSCSYLDGDTPTIRRIRMSDDGTITTTTQTFYNKTQADAALNNKQDTITDLATIRSGAALGATALQSFTEADPTVPTYVKAITEADIERWNEGGGNVDDVTINGESVLEDKIAKLSAETWTFVLDDGSEVTKDVVLK